MASFHHRIERALANEARAGRRSADATRPIDALASIAAMHCRVGLAVLANGEIRWSNPDFDETVGDLGREIADRVERLEADRPTDLAALVDLSPDDCRSEIPLYGYVGEAFTVVTVVTGSFGASRSDRTRSTDPVTRLPDRTGMERDLTLPSRQIPLDVMFIDVGDFDELSERYGPSAGEQILREVRRRLLEASQAEDVVYRNGIHEFVILGPDMRAAHDETGDPISRRFVRAVSSTPILLDGEDGEDEEVFVTVTAALGRVETGSSGSASTERTQASTSRAEETRDDVTPHGSWAHDEVAVERRAEITDAIHARQFELHYQPIVTLETGETVGHEALLRLVLRDDLLLAPAEFMAQAETMGAAEEVGEWVASRAIHDLVNGEPTRSLGMSINVSPAHFASRSLPRFLEGVIGAFDVDPELLVVEISESAILSDEIDVAVELKELAALGVRIALDDFGTGYSSLTHLADLQIDVIKLDNRFVSHIDMERSDNSIAEVVMAVGRTLGCDVVAEGIERNEQRLALLELGCPYGQGYYFGYPSPLPSYSLGE